MIVMCITANFTKDAPSLDFKSLQLPLLGTMPKHFFNNCCLLIYGNSIGFRCEHVDAGVTGVQLHLVMKEKKICRCTSQGGLIWKKQQAAL